MPVGWRRGRPGLWCIGAACFPSYLNLLKDSRKEKKKHQMIVSA
jgi:hypothetical protein